jgi:hypothetical protein
MAPPHILCRHHHRQVIPHLDPSIHPCPQVSTEDGAGGSLLIKPGGGDEAERPASTSELWFDLIIAASLAKLGRTKTSTNPGLAITYETSSDIKSLEGGS